MLLDAAIPSSLHGLLLKFAPCFTCPGFENFVTLITGWITCQGRHSISRVIQASGDPARDKKKHHSTYYRFLSQGRWSIDSLAERIFHLLLPVLPKEITLIIDDTLCAKSGPHIFGAAMHYDAHASTYGRGTSTGGKKFFAFGHNWVVAAVWLPLPWNPDRGFAIPFVIRLYRSKKYTPRRSYRKRTEIAAEMVELVASWTPADRQLHVLGDGEYSCKNVVRNLPAGVTFTGSMVMDAALYDVLKSQPGRGRPRKKGKRMPSPQQLAGKSSIPWTELTLTIYGQEVTILVKTQKCLWYTVAGTQRISMVVTRDPSGRLSDRAFFSTNDEFGAGEVLTHFTHRWEIEVAFRNTKQAMGIEDPQNGWWRRKSASHRPKKRPGPNADAKKGETAVNHTLALAFAAHAIVVAWYLRHGKCDDDVARVKRDAPWYTHKKRPSFADMLAAVRRELWAARFSLDPDFKWVSEKIDDVFPHWLLAA